MNKELLEILLQFYSEKPKSKSVESICRNFRVKCKRTYQVSCTNCVLGRGNIVPVVHEKLDQIQITLKVITDEP